MQFFTFSHTLEDQSKYDNMPKTLIGFYRHMCHTTYMISINLIKRDQLRNKIYKLITIVVVHFQRSNYLINY